jgi:isopentenyl-diphosphate Delta-isomerase
MIEYLDEEIILVDKNDNKLGLCGKMKAHLEGKLHRAFSVFVFNSEGELLLQKRAYEKYHSGGLWTNTCCSHPRDSEDIEEAVHRRLNEELGFDCPIKKILGFYYKAKLDNNVYEHEYDHVFIGKYNGVPKPNPNEVDDWLWINIEELLNRIKRNPSDFTYWFKLVLNDVLNFDNKV